MFLCNDNKSILVNACIQMYKFPWNIMSLNKSCGMYIRERIFEVAEYIINEVAKNRTAPFISR